MAQFRYLVTVALFAGMMMPVGEALAAPPQQPYSPSFLGALANARVSDQTLAAAHGKNIPVNSIATGYVSNNTSSGPTGTISDVNSINGNQGFTTVIQNTGNNSLFQTSTVVNITMSK